MNKHSSLKSLLTLAAGASALPFTADAAIHYTDLGIPQTVGFGAGELSSLDIDLPGTAILAFARANSSSSNRILANQNAGYVRIGRQSKSRSMSGLNGLNVAFRTNAGVRWNSATGRTDRATFGNIIRSSTTVICGPGAFSNKYLLFTFIDSSNGNQLEFGWVGMSAATITPGVSANMSVTLTGWAYQDDGNPIASGAIPEPASAGLAMGGALVLGAAGLRQWRKRKAATAKTVGDLIAS